MDDREVQKEVTEGETQCSEGRHLCPSFKSLESASHCFEVGLLVEDLSEAPPEVKIRYKFAMDADMKRRLPVLVAFTPTMGDTECSSIIAWP